MDVWLVYREEDSKKNAWYIEQYQLFAAKYNLNISLILTESLTLLCDERGNQVLVNGQELAKPKLAIVRTIDPYLSKHLELSGIHVVNSSIISEICNHKARTYQEIAKLKLPMIPTLFCRRDSLHDVMEKRIEKTVIKTVDGHGGQEVFLLDPALGNMQPVLNEILSKTSSDFVIQPLIGKHHQDLRVYVLGKEILAAVLRTSRSEFKANFSLGGEVKEYHLSEDQKQRVYKIIDHFTFDLVGIDFIIGDDYSLIFNEIEDVVGARMLYHCSTVNIVDCYLKYLGETYSNL